VEDTWLGRISGHGRFTPEPGENLMWAAIPVEIRILEVDEGGFHQYAPFEHSRIFARIPVWSSYLRPCIRPESTARNGLPVQTAHSDGISSRDQSRLKLRFAKEVSLQANLLGEGRLEKK